MIFLIWRKNYVLYFPGGLNKKETELNLVNMFSVWYLTNSIYLHNDSKGVKLGRAVTFMKYIASIVS